MSAADNKRLLQTIFAELANGNSRPFVEHMADDFRWTVTGRTKWSKTYEGKQAVLTELFGALRTQIADRARTIPDRFIAEDDYVVVEAHGQNTTRRGMPYNNVYCFVIRVTDGKLKELTEYMWTPSWSRLRSWTRCDQSTVVWGHTFALLSRLFPSSRNLMQRLHFERPKRIRSHVGEATPYRVIVV